jgi:hypothetical protein
MSKIETELARWKYRFENYINRTSSSAEPREFSKRVINDLFYKLKLGVGSKSFELQKILDKHLMLEWSTRSELTGFGYSGQKLVFDHEGKIYVFDIDYKIGEVTLRKAYTVFCK